MMVTASPRCSATKTAAKLAKQAFKEGKTIRELVSEQKLIDDAELDRLLDPRSMTAPTPPARQVGNADLGEPLRASADSGRAETVTPL